jgi:hypothetical protein
MLAQEYRLRCASPSHTGLPDDDTDNFERHMHADIIVYIHVYHVLWKEGTIPV